MPGRHTDVRTLATGAGGIRDKQEAARSGPQRPQSHSQCRVLERHTRPRRGEDHGGRCVASACCPGNGRWCLTVDSYCNTCRLDPYSTGADTTFYSGAPPYSLPTRTFFALRAALGSFSRGALAQSVRRALTARVASPCRPFGRLTHRPPSPLSQDLPTDIYASLLSRAR